MPFRDAHEAAGGCVRIAEARGVELHDLTDEELRTVSPMLTPDVRDRLDVVGSLASRSGVGGTAPEQVLAQVAGLRRRIDELRTEYDSCTRLASGPPPLAH